MEGYIFDRNPSQEWDMYIENTFVGECNEKIFEFIDDPVVDIVKHATSRRRGI